MHLEQISIEWNRRRLSPFVPKAGTQNLAPNVRLKLGSRFRGNERDRVSRQLKRGPTHPGRTLWGTARRRQSCGRMAVLCDDGRPQHESTTHDPPTGLDRTARPDRDRPDPCPRRPDLRAAVRRLGRQGDQDRDAGGGAGRDAIGLRGAARPGFPEPAPQQACHDAQPQERGRQGGAAPAGRARRHHRRELPARREGEARHRLRRPEQDQSPADLRQHLGLRPGRALPRPASRSPISRPACLPRWAS
jgi:hypothetical protein